MITNRYVLGEATLLFFAALREPNRGVVRPLFPQSRKAAKKPVRRVFCSLSQNWSRKWPRHCKI